MDEMTVRQHDFERIKEELKTLSQKAKETSAKEIKPARTKSRFIGNHVVTGAELNDLIECINKWSLQFKQRNIETAEGFIKVSNLMEALDRDYIKYLWDNHKNTNDTVKQLEITVDSLKETKETTDKNYREIKNQEIHGKGVEEKADYAIEEIAMIKTLFAEKERTHKEQITVLANKLKLSYIAVGGSTTIVVAQLILNILGII